MLAIDPPEDHFNPPLLSQEKFLLQAEFQPDDNLESSPSSDAGDSHTVSLTELDGLGVSSRPDNPEIAEHAEDDTAATSKPSRQVDYLSPDWKEEEEIWLSWRYIISKRGELANSGRLENASWRAWTKVRNNLKTILAEQLNWLKDSDVTWLYGPVLRGPKSTNARGTKSSFVTLSKTNCLVKLSNKSILKKRSVSEVMLQRSLESASLLKQPTPAIQVQETQDVLKHKTVKSLTDYCGIYCPSRKGRSNDSGSSMILSRNSFCISPYPERKYIHFDEQVDQCIAIDVKDDDDDDCEQDCISEVADSDDGGVMMQFIISKKQAPSSKKRSTFTNSSGRIISKPPSTTLRCREDAPEPRETAMKHGASVLPSPIVSPSSSQETLRPTMPSPRVFFVEDDDNGSSDEGVMPRSDWKQRHRSASSASLTDVPTGMCRTPSGMFMPCEEGDTPTTDGIIGRVRDTVNTARDIAYVILNVGWKK